HGTFFLCIKLLYLRDLADPRRPAAILSLILQAALQAAGLLVIVALVFCPLALFIANLFERRASFRLRLQQEYGPLASTMFYSLAASSLAATIVTIAAQLSGVQAALAGRMLNTILAERAQFPPEVLSLFDQGLITPGLISAMLSL